MFELSEMQLKGKAEEFVNEYKRSSDADISKIIAGMTAIIKGNDTAYENMKNQRWFQRIWYGITGRNKATVKEMQQNRDSLTKYMIQILVKMNGIITEHSECIFDLYRALSVVRCDLDRVVDEVTNLAITLNEKIDSVDNYNIILNDIRNNQYDSKTPLISMIDIMSLIDNRTSNDTKKMKQIKDTMEIAGFDFSKQVSIQTLSEEVLSLPEEKSGRILLFCQSLSSSSRFLAFICILIENYFYLGQSDRRIVRENGEAVKSALETACLNTNSYCIVNDMFTDLKDGLQQWNGLIKYSENAKSLQSDEKPIPEPESKNVPPNEKRHIYGEKKENIPPRVTALERIYDVLSHSSTSKSPSNENRKEDNKSCFDCLSPEQLQHIKENPNTHVVYQGWIYYIDVDHAYTVEVANNRRTKTKQLLVSKAYAVKENGTDNKLISGDSEVIVDSGISVERITEIIDNTPLWNCQEMCSRRIPKICNRQVSGGMVSQPG